MALKQYGANVMQEGTTKYTNIIEMSPSFYSYVTFVVASKDELEKFKVYRNQFQSHFSWLE